MASEFTARIRAELEKSSLSSISKQIESIGKDKLKVSFDAKSLNDQLNSIDSKLKKLGNVKISIGTSGSGSSASGASSAVKEVNQAYNDLMKLQKQINSIRIKVSGLDSTKDAAQIEELGDQLQRLSADYNNVYSAFSKKLSTSQIDNLSNSFEQASNKIKVLNAAMDDTSAVKSTESAYQELLSTAKQISSLEIQIAKLDSTKDAAQIEELSGKLTGLKATYSGLNAAFGQKLSTEQFSNITSVAAKTEAELSKLASKSRDVQTSLSNSITQSFNNGSITTSIAKVTAQYEKLGGAANSNLSQVTSGLQKIASLQSDLSGANGVEKQITAYKEYNQVMAQVKNTISQVKTDGKGLASALEIKTLDNKIATWMEKNTKASKEFGASITELRNQLNSGFGSITTGGLADIENQFKSIQQSAVALNKTGNTFGNTFRRAFASISNYVTVSMILYEAVNTAKQMYNAVSDIDSAMVELNKVSDASSSQLAQTFENSKASAREYATVLSDIISATADWSRLGFNLQDSEELAKVAALYKNVGDNITIATANESLISTLKGFNLEASDAVSIVDKFNEVDILASFHSNVIAFPKGIDSNYIGQKLATA